MKHFLIGGLSLAALAAYCLLFEFRYAWYANSSQVVVLRSTLALSVAGIVIAWVFHPTALVIVLIATAGLIAPAIYDPSSFAKPDWAFGAYSVVCVALLVGVTTMWQSSRN